MENKMEIKLGFCEKPDIKFIFVTKGNSPDQLWYSLDQAKSPVYYAQNTIACYIRGIEVKDVTTSCGTEPKVDIAIMADRPYVLRGGLHTNYIKSLFMALVQVTDFSQPLFISLEPGEKTVIFAQVFNANKEVVKVNWKGHETINVLDLIASVDSRLSNRSRPHPIQANSTFNSIQDQKLSVQEDIVPPWLEGKVDRNIVLANIESLCTRKNIDAQRLGLLLVKAGHKSLAEMNETQLTEFRDRLEKFRP